MNKYNAIASSPIKWVRDEDKDLIACDGKTAFLIVAERDSWFGNKVTGWWLTLDPGTSAQRSLRFDRQRDAKEFAAGYQR